MISTAIIGIESPSIASTPETTGVTLRRVGAQAGRALEKLAHAIEYLSDEYVLDPGPLPLHDGRLQALDILMSLNRQVYLEQCEIRQCSFVARVCGFVFRLAP